jgi:intein/homing endonuclease
MTLPVKTEPPEWPAAVESALDAFLWMCGHWVADGVIEGAGTTGISIIDDRRGVEQFTAIAALAGLTAKSKPHANAHCVRISNADLARFMLANFGKRGEGKRLPMWLLGAPQQLQERFLEGYLFGDGHWNEPRQRWEISSASRELAMGIKLLAQSLGYHTTFSWVDPKATHVQGVALQRAPQRSYRVQIKRDGQGIVEDGMCWSRIRRITPVGERQVFDLVVDEDFSYVADGIVHKGSSDPELRQFR